jgi:hypothetical protein
MERAHTSHEREAEERLSLLDSLKQRQRLLVA